MSNQSKSKKQFTIKIRFIFIIFNIRSSCNFEEKYREVVTKFKSKTKTFSNTFFHINFVPLPPFVSSWFQYMRKSIQEQFRGLLSCYRRVPVESLPWIKIKKIYEISNSKQFFKFDFHLWIRAFEPKVLTYLELQTSFFWSF